MTELESDFDVDIVCRRDRIYYRRARQGTRLAVYGFAMLWLLGGYAPISTRWPHEGVMAELDPNTVAALDALFWPCIAVGLFALVVGVYRRQSELRDLRRTQERNR